MPALIFSSLFHYLTSFFLSFCLFLSSCPSAYCFSWSFLPLFTLLCSHRLIRTPLSTSLASRWLSKGRVWPHRATNGLSNRGAGWRCGNTPQQHQHYKERWEALSAEWNTGGTVLHILAQMELWEGDVSYIRCIAFCTSVCVPVRLLYICMSRRSMCFLGVTEPHENILHLPHAKQEAEDAYTFRALLHFSLKIWRLLLK